MLNIHNSKQNAKVINPYIHTHHLSETATKLLLTFASTSFFFNKNWSIWKQILVVFNYCVLYSASLKNVAFFCLGNHMLL